MENLVRAVLKGPDQQMLQQLILALGDSGNRYFLRNEILQQFESLCIFLEKPKYFFHASVLGELLHYTHELLIDDQNFWMILRPRVANQEIFRISIDLGDYQKMHARDLLDSRDRFVARSQPHILEIDFEPFINPDLSISDPRNIGEGLHTLTRYLINAREKDPTQWSQNLFLILRECHYDDHPLMINHQIANLQELSKALMVAQKYLDQQDALSPALDHLAHLRTFGLEPGWGHTVGRVQETMALFERVLTVPSAALLDSFIQRIPNVFRVVLISVHGWVSQQGVLGKAETAGQVAYVLDQAVYLERNINEAIRLSGLSHLNVHPDVVILTRLIPDCEGTHCNLKFEAIKGTQFTRILRVPFRTQRGEVVESWISKFSVWPYLEKFADEAIQELNALFGSEKPDLIIGNYSDGNLVGYHLANAFDTLQCNIAHALEKTKHLFGDLYWQDLEQTYHFSAQFSADLITMNAADFIITSSIQEITGSHDSTGQYESYSCFTMPHLYHVVNGINLCSSKFNVVPPGVNEEVFFPFTEADKRDPDHVAHIQQLIFSNQDSASLGDLEDPDKPSIFAFTPVQAIKNLPELIEGFGKNQALRERCNLILLTGSLDPDAAVSFEQREILERLHQLITQYKLQSQVRWIGKRLPSQDLAEVYRLIADRRGLFMNCARFEAFGLTLLEAMSSGLPVFSTKFGGPSEIIEHGKNGFLINPTQPEEAMNQVFDFLSQCQADADAWVTVSSNSIQRVKQHYQWDRHCDKLLALAKTHRVLKPFQSRQSAQLKKYLDVLYHHIHRLRLSNPEPPTSPTPRPDIVHTT